MQGQDDESLATTGPLSQILDQEEGVKNVQTVRRSVQGENMRVLKQSAGERQPSGFGCRQSIHQTVFGRLQTELVQNSLSLERSSIIAASQQHVEAESLLSRKPGTQAILRWQVSDA